MQECSLVFNPPDHITLKSHNSRQPTISVPIFHTDMGDIDRELNSLTKQLSSYQVEEQGLSFFGKSLKLNNEKDGKMMSYCLGETK